MMVLALGFLGTVPEMPVAAAQGAQPGTIRVQVANRSPGGPVAGLLVHLRTTIDGRGRVVGQVLSDETGVAQFDRLPLASYQAEVERDGGRYRSAVISLSAATPHQEVSVVVYDASGDPLTIQVERQTLVVAGVEGSAPQAAVIELLTIQNPTDRAYVGDRVADPGVGLPPVYSRTLRIPMPTGSTDFVPRLGLPADEMVPIVGGWASRLPLPPGTTEVSYSYRIGYAFGLLLLDRELPYGARQFNLLVPDVGLEVASPDLAPAGGLDLQGHRYAVYSGANLPPGKRVLVRIAGFDSESRGLAVDPRGARVVAAGVLVAALALLAWRVGQTAPRDPARLATLEDQLIGSLAALDERFARGELGEPQYQEQRARLKRQLVGIMRAQRAESPAEQVS
ncbi:MAG: hypothetical protein HYY04_17730 [Chloroflexi bacterium]|nr:hypothetical protein [Chloroflexota bacterium]